MASQPIQHHVRGFPWITAGAVILAWVVPSWPGARELLILDRAQCLEGELWRLLTCHWVHVSWSHLTVDTLLMGLGGILLEGRRRRCVLPVIALSALGISMAVWWLKPEWKQYSGLSGIVMAVWSAVSVDCLASNRRERLIGLGLTAFLLAKIGMDVLTTAPLVATWTDDCVESATLAHAVGWLTGALLATSKRVRRRSKLRANPCVLRHSGYTPLSILPTVESQKDPSSDLVCSIATRFN